MPLRPFDPDDPADLAAVGRVHALSRHAAYAGLVPAEALARVTPDSQTANWRHRMAQADEPHALLLWEHEGQVVGFTLGSAAGETGTLQALHLLPALHGTGAGPGMHDAMLDRFDGWGCTLAELWVVSGNARAQAFYRRHGWSDTGERRTKDVGGAAVADERWTRPVRLPAG
ncbi:MAG: N-acetyltransferase family protein [Nocardioidaceae bacterium]